MKQLEIRGKVMVEGQAEGEAVVSNRAFTFAHGVDPTSGIVTDIRSDIRNLNVKGKILVYPFGKGSTTGASWFLETARNGNEPKAVLTNTAEPIIVVGSVLAKILYDKTIPVMSEFSEDITETIRTNDRVSVDGKKGLVIVRGKT
jgi:predicted aconitase with swiveling domain